MDRALTRKKDWVLTSAAFNTLLSRLDPDRDRAGQEYERIRRALELFFRSRGCQAPEDMADETFDRVARRLSEGVEIYTANPFLYCYGVALKVLREEQRRRPTRLLLEDVAAAVADADADSAEASEFELQLECMRRCLQNLSVETREMLTEYKIGRASCRERVYVLV